MLQWFQSEGSRPRRNRCFTSSPGAGESARKATRRPPYCYERHCSECGRTNVCPAPTSGSLGCLPRVELLDHVVRLRLIFEEPSHFFTEAAPSHVLIGNLKGSPSPTFGSF